MILRVVTICCLLLGGLSVAACSIVLARKQLDMKRPQFSLRALLLAMTLVGVALGLILYYLNRPPGSPPVNHVDVPVF